MSTITETWRPSLLPKCTTVYVPCWLSAAVSASAPEYYSSHVIENQGLCCRPQWSLSSVKLQPSWRFNRVRFVYQSTQPGGARTRASDGSARSYTRSLLPRNRHSRWVDERLSVVCQIPSIPAPLADSVNGWSSGFVFCRWSCEAVNVVETRTTLLFSYESVG